MAVKALKCIRCGPAAHEDWVDRLTIELNGGSASNPVARYLIDTIAVCGTIQFDSEQEAENPYTCLGCYSSCAACIAS